MQRRPTPHNAQCYWEDTNTTDIVTLLHKHVCTQKQICSIYSLHNAMKTNVAQCTMYSVTGTNINTNNNIANRIQREMGTKECLLHYVLGTKTRTVAKTTLFFNCCLKILKKLYVDAHSFVCKRLSIFQSFNRQFSTSLFHSLQHCKIHEHIDT